MIRILALQNQLQNDFEPEIQQALDNLKTSRDQFLANVNEASTFEELSLISAEIEIALETTDALLDILPGRSNHPDFWEEIDSWMGEAVLDPVHLVGNIATDLDYISS